MSRIVAIYGKKLFSLALIFNSLLTIVYAIGLLSAFYVLYPGWKPYYPYVVNGQLFWILIPAALINIFPCVNIGKVDTGRLWFHHYVYGFIVLAISAALTAFFAPSAILTLFTADTTDLCINIGRFFILGGLTLVIDDLPDVSKKLKSALRSAKSKAQQNGKILHAIQLVMGFVSLYFFVAIAIYLPQHPREVTLANAILLGTLLVTSLTSFASVIRKDWLSIDLETTEIGLSALRLKERQACRGRFLLSNSSLQESVRTTPTSAILYLSDSSWLTTYNW
jgi:hypothetical protein